MRALVFDGTDMQLQRQRPAPEPAAGEAVIRTIKAGISALERAVCRGRTCFTGVPGHEFVGRVERVGENTDRSFVGKRVVGAASTSCGECDMCQGGLSNHCRTRTVLGYLGRDGCLAESFTIPAKGLVLVPDEVDDDRAVFAHALAASIHAARQLTIEGKPYITVLGDGPLGLLMVQVMAKLNASVRLIGRHPEKFGLCEKWGIKHRHIDEIGLRADQDVVVDCTGTNDGLTAAMQIVRPRGKVILKTLPVQCNASDSSDQPIDLSPLVMHEIELIGSFEGPIGEAVAMLESEQVDVVSLIARRMPLDDAANALRLADRPETLKVLIEV